MPPALSFRLSLMMFVEFFIWGAWYVTVGNYMTEIELTGAIYWAYTVSPIAAVVSPFFLGMVADRFFATEKILAVLHLLGGLAILLAPRAASSATLFILLLLLHVLFYMPTLGLTNSLAFHHIHDQEKQFPLIRVFGTLGWIAANVLVSAILGADATPIPLYTAGVASIVMAGYALTLPHTPPRAAGTKPTVRSILGLDALKTLSSRPFLIFIACSLLICIPLSAYYAYAPVFVSAAGLSSPAFKMSFGQMSEVLFMLAMPIFFARLGVKWMLVVGMSAWVLRYALFAFAAPTGSFWLIMTAIGLHGICYDFFFVTGQIYVDKKSSGEIRGQAQGFLVLVTYGVGMLVGALVAGWVFNAIVPEVATLASWQTFWWLPAAFAAAVLLMFGVTFSEASASRS
ncbi:MAG TPA: MFS transporter [Vicinamibacteria bacterium]|nr:MFS transporter [Vicinamibacteria bacterium]